MMATAVFGSPPLMLYRLCRAACSPRWVYFLMRRSARSCTHTPQAFLKFSSSKGNTTSSRARARMCAGARFVLLLLYSDILSFITRGTDLSSPPGQICPPPRPNLSSPTTKFVPGQICPRSDLSSPPTGTRAVSTRWLPSCALVTAPHWMSCPIARRTCRTSVCSRSANAWLVR